MSDYKSPLEEIVFEYAEAMKKLLNYEKSIKSLLSSSVNLAMM